MQILKPSPELSRLFNATHLAVVSGEGAPNDGLFDLACGGFYGTAYPL
jgi:hypothetical protein